MKVIFQIILISYPFQSHFVRRIISQSSLEELHMHTGSHCNVHPGERLSEIIDDSNVERKVNILTSDFFVDARF